MEELGKIVKIGRGVAEMGVKYLYLCHFVS